MKALIQRVRHASVSLEGKIFSQIGSGMLIFLGVAVGDEEKQADYLAKKIAALRIFDDENGVMNRDIVAAGGELLAVSQFTLLADSRKGNRPSYIRAAKPEISRPLYEYFCRTLAREAQRPVQQGQFGADMQVTLLNDGPVTIMIDTETNLK